MAVSRLHVEGNRYIPVFVDVAAIHGAESFFRNQTV
jgi:hypothetical protein